MPAAALATAAQSTVPGDVLAAVTDKYADPRHLFGYLSRVHEMFVQSQRFRRQSRRQAQKAG